MTLLSHTHNPSCGSFQAFIKKNMNYETETIDGHTIVVRHMFKGPEILPGSRWINSSAHIVTIEELRSYMFCSSEDPIKEYECCDVYYSWQENNQKLIAHEEIFNFQCSYFLILE